MDDFWIKILFAIPMVIGVFGAILPLLPGAPIAFVALLLAKIFHFSELSWWVVIFFGLLTIIGVVLDYTIPIFATKKLGGSKYGIWGLLIGMVVGIVFSPFGFVSILIAPFLGAIIGELIHDRNESKRAVKAAAGSIIGYMITSGYGILLCSSIFVTFLIHDIL